MNTTTFQIRPTVSFEIQKIIGVSTGDGNVRNFQVQWAPCWINDAHLVGCEKLIQEFLNQTESCSREEVEIKVSSHNNVRIIENDTLIKEEPIDEQITFVQSSECNESLSQGSNDMERGALESTSNGGVSAHSNGRVSSHFSNHNDSKFVQYNSTKFNNSYESSDIPLYDKGFDNNVGYNKFEKRTLQKGDTSRIDIPRGSVQQPEKGHLINNLAKRIQSSNNIKGKMPRVVDYYQKEDDSLDNTLFSQEVAQIDSNNKVKESAETSWSLSSENNIDIDDEEIVVVNCDEMANYNVDQKTSEQPPLYSINQKSLDERPAICNICGKSFRCRQNVRRHVKEVHSGKKPYKCPICAKDFIRKEGVKYHMRSFHKQIHDDEG